MSYCIYFIDLHTSKSCSRSLAKTWITTWPWIIWKHLIFWSISVNIFWIFFGRFFEVFLCLKAADRLFFWGFGRSFLHVYVFPVHLILFFQWCMNMFCRLGLSWSVSEELWKSRKKSLWLCTGTADNLSRYHCLCLLASVDTRVYLSLWSYGVGDGLDSKDA